MPSPRYIVRMTDQMLSMRQRSQRTALLSALLAIVVVGGTVIATRPPVVDLAAPSTDCGQEGFRVEGNSDDVRRCILAAYQQQTPAHSAHVRETMEGDPITHTVRVHGRDDFDLTIDHTRDRFGSSLGVVQYRCTGMRISDGGARVLRLFNCGAGVAVFDL
jgi:hypothetical protein